METRQSSNRSTTTRLPRVAMLGSFAPQAQGITEYCGEIAQALSQRLEVLALGFKRMYPAALFPGNRASMDKSKKPLLGPHLQVSHTLTWYNPWSWLAAARRTPADIFHAQWWSLPLWPVFMLFLLVMRWRRIPIVLTVHNVIPHEKNAIFLHASKSLCRLSQCVIVQSDADLRQLLATYSLPPARCIRIPMGAHMAKPEPLSKEEACARLGLPVERNLLLSFGTIRAYKGIDVLLDAFASVARHNHEVDLVVAGKPWVDWAPYQETIDREGLGGRVHLFLDYRPENEIPLFFSAADLIVLPYTHFPSQSAVGALALPHRKPLIVSDEGQLPDWVDGDQRWIARSGDAQSLARRIDSFLSDPEEATRAFLPVADRVLKRFSWESIAERYVELYREVLLQSQERR